MEGAAMMVTWQATSRGPPTEIEPLLGDPKGQMESQKDLATLLALDTKTEPR